MTNIWYQFLGLLSSFTLSSAVDVLLVSFIIYQFIKLIRETRAEQLVKGILILLIVWSAANLFDLQMMKTILSYVFNFSVIALMIVFQPEVRRALEQMGRSGLRKGFGLVQKEEDMEKEKRRCIQAVSEAADNFQRSKTGALIVFERETKLGDIIDTGTVVNAIPSVPLIGNIFWNKAPLHDGAMVIRESMVYAAGCILPLTKSDTVSVDLGTRHRAGIGMSENSDAVILIVSEETGQISLAVNGRLTRNYSKETLQEALEGYLLTEEKAERRIPSLRRIKKQ
ncbi:MAG: diadenylate cyclase CdaA [Hydrogeniiclostridium sp.]